MRALFYTGTGQSALREARAPRAEAGQSVVRVSHCGICGSDMHAWHGLDPRRVAPLILGHEAAGWVEEGPLAGQRVALNPLMSCGDCASCRGGREHLCATRELIGMRLPGAFAEAVAIKSENLSPLPDTLSFAEAALAEPLACAVHAVRLGLERAGPPGHQDAVVLGGGAIGLLSALVFRSRGIGGLRIAETNALRRAALERILPGAAYDPMAGESATDRADILLDAVGSGATRRAASALTRPGGTIVHIGLQDSAEGLDTRRLTLQEITFIGTYCYTRADFAEALRLLSEGDISGAGWAEIRPLAEGPGAFEDIDAGRAPPKIILSMG